MSDSLLWQSLFAHTNLKLPSYDLRKPDYLSLCLRDAKRLVYLSLDSNLEFY